MSPNKNNEANRGVPQRLADVAPDLKLILESEPHTPARCVASAIRRETIFVTMRDGIRLATDLYLPPDLPAPAIAVRTPYGRTNLADTVLPLAQRGYVVVTQDVRGTGDSEPDTWEMYIYEREDGIDFVEWITQQPWFDGFVGSFGGSYGGSTQWGMSMHPRMSAIAPEVAGIGISRDDTPNFYMFVNAFSRAVGKGIDKEPIPLWEMERRILPETLADGYFNEPLHTPLSAALLEHYPNLQALSPTERKRWLWDHYRPLPPAQRAELIKRVTGQPSVTYDNALSEIFGREIPYGLFTFPSAGKVELARSLHAPALIITGWYDWGNGDTLATWSLLTREGSESARSRSRLLIAPCAHNMPGYREGRENHPELDLIYRSTHSGSAYISGNHRTANVRDLLLRWYAAVRENTLDSWPVVTYYLMGANEWYTASAWPPPAARICALYLGSSGTLNSEPPQQASNPDTYIYDPEDPTPTVGGSILSYVYAPGSADVSEVQRRADVLSYTTSVFASDLDVVGPLRLILYASSSAVDTDFSARLTDVFPDGRAIHLQNCTLRVRHRNTEGEPELLEPGRIYRFEIDLWATANRFKAGHRLRLDICSADFPKFDRNANRGGEPGAPIRAVQSLYHDPEHPSHLLVSIMGSAP
ncbi:CocE/NonD family hydrolase [Peristeroidobacter agariperforans]|uniref:CocE/NonD family hydrolase n=1 Tax=Peristeroidobacter agariperforans TaxID=268404 RepID=UPI00101DCF3B|nr:CocE/NonD family hydrolase [Peristeroidobacter agariperforans]